MVMLQMLHYFTCILLPLVTDVKESFSLRTSIVMLSVRKARRMRNLKSVLDVMFCLLQLVDHCHSIRLVYWLLLFCLVGF